VSRRVPTCTIFTIHIYFHSHGDQQIAPRQKAWLAASCHAMLHSTEPNRVRGRGCGACMRAAPMRAHAHAWHACPKNGLPAPAPAGFLAALCATHSAPTDSPEGGSGKPGLAAMLHATGPRRGRGLQIARPCAAWFGPYHRILRDTVRITRIRSGRWLNFSHFSHFFKKLSLSVMNEKGYQEQCLNAALGAGCVQECIDRRGGARVRGARA
jgi:hypothetical protein